MKKKRISKKLEDDRRRLAEMSDDEIDTEEIPEISPEKFVQALVRKGLEAREPKAQLTLRLDRDVLDWFRKQGRGYQTRINALLRAYMQANQKGSANKPMHGTDSPTDPQVPNGA